MAMPLARSDDRTAAEIRAETRTHLFLVAILSSGTAVTTVRIRNLSASGALIESSELPPVGAPISIRRASLAADGVVVWRSANQAGVAFNANLYVSDWLPKNSRATQCTVDELIYNVKNCHNDQSDQRRPALPPASHNADFAELTSLRCDLVTLADRLVQDVVLVATHPEIQLLDVAIQKIDRILKQKVAENSSASSI